MKKLRIFLANIGRRGSYRLCSPPLGLLYLASYTRTKFDLEFKIFDQRAENCEDAEVIRQAKEFKPDIIGFTCFTSHGHLLPWLTQAAREAVPDALIVLGGPHTSAVEEDSLNNTSADMAVIGEGELSFEQIIHARLDGSDFSAIPGLVWRDRDGVVKMNPGQPPLIDDLDTLPFPAFDLIDLKRYWKLWSQSLVPPPRKFIPLFSSRGCPYKCIYCHKVFGKQFRAHSAQRIVDEIAYFQKQYGIDEVEFFDDIFNFDRKRILEFSECLTRNNVHVKMALPNSFRGDAIREDVIDALVDAGLYIAAFALESGSPRMQKFFRKQLNIPRFLEGVEMAVKRGVFAYGFQMFGFPTETEEDVKMTLDVTCQSAFHAALFYRVVPYPNTELYKMIKETHPEKLAQISYADSDYTYRPPVNLSDIPDDVLTKLIHQGSMRFYGNPKRLYRIMRDYPRRWALPWYLPNVLFLMLKRPEPAARAPEMA